MNYSTEWWNAAKIAREMGRDIPEYTLRAPPTVAQIAEWEAMVHSPVPEEFRALATEEPFLWELAAQAVRMGGEQHGSGKPYCANADWYGQLKPSLCELVEWTRKEHPVLGTGVAYALAYETIYELLPDCSHSSECWR
jgi:hypothetical protein